MKTLDLGTAQPKQVLFLKDKHRHIAYGGARGGGKSWAVRVKAILLASKYPGINAAIHSAGIRRSWNTPEILHQQDLRSARTACG